MAEEMVSVPKRDIQRLVGILGRIPGSADVQYKTRQNRTGPSKLPDFSALVDDVATGVAKSQEVTFNQAQELGALLQLKRDVATMRRVLGTSEAH